jgi:hypothetical protein
VTPRRLRCATRWFANNNAVAEAEALAALFTERVAPLGELYLAEFIFGSGETSMAHRDGHGSTRRSDFRHGDAHGGLSLH